MLQGEGVGHSKIRLTGPAAENLAGEKLTMFVIHKSQKFRCFKEINSLEGYD